MSGENEKWTEEFKIRPPCSPVGQRLIKILVSRKSLSAPLCLIPDEQSARLFCCILNCCRVSPASRVSPAIHFRCAHISFLSCCSASKIFFVTRPQHMSCCSFTAISTTPAHCFCVTSARRVSTGKHERVVSGVGSVNAICQRSISTNQRKDRFSL